MTWLSELLSGFSECSQTIWNFLDLFLNICMLINFVTIFLIFIYISWILSFLNCISRFALGRLEPGPGAGSAARQGRERPRSEPQASSGKRESS